MEVISKREVKRKKKSHSSTFQKYHSHAGRKPSWSSSSLLSIVGRALGWSEGLGGGKAVGKGLQSQTHMHANDALVVPSSLPEYSMTCQEPSLCGLPGLQNSHFHGLCFMNSALAWRRTFSSPYSSLVAWWVRQGWVQVTGLFSIRILSRPPRPHSCSP